MDAVTPWAGTLCHVGRGGGGIRLLCRSKEAGTALADAPGAGAGSFAYALNLAGFGGDI